jgi:hypothetical protein
MYHGTAYIQIRIKKTTSSYYGGNAPRRMSIRVHRKLFEYIIKKGRPQKVPEIEVLSIYHGTKAQMRSEQNAKVVRTQWAS